MSYSWLGFISQTKLWMFNVSVLDSYIPVCHSSVVSLGPASQRKVIFFTTLKGDYHLTACWCCMNNSKGPTFMSPSVLRASACNGSLISNMTKSSNLTDKNSYCILTTGHHKRILTKIYKKVKKKNWITLPFHPLCLHLLPAALMSLTTCFQETPLRPRLTTPKVFYALRKDISS
jgi:hypothetical protein